MKKLFLLLTLFTSLSLAQTTKELNLDCYPLEPLLTEISKYGEVPLLLANSVREENGRANNYATLLLVNAETRTWTLLEKANDENYCVLAMGNFLRPIIKDKPL